MIPDLTIAPGDRQYDFKAKLSNEALAALIGIVGSGSGAALTIKGNGTEINGVDIPWLTAPLSALEVNVPIAVPGA